ncbi:MAG: gluconolaconase, partial [Acidobacteriota bacterium]|nr:gluconolaconase [Acidobacteriota bacterium]
MSGAGRIVRIDPAAGIAGGEVVIECEGLDREDVRSCRVMFGDERAWLIGASPRRMLAVVPELDDGHAIEVWLDKGATRSAGAAMVVGAKLADDLHLVANPAFDPEDGSLYVTRSGSRGQRMPVSLLRIDADAQLSTMHGEIVNPTGIAFNASGQMFVTSRMDGTVYRVTPFDDVEAFARNLGVATGLAFDREGLMYVGDRSGTIHRVNGIGDTEEWASLEPSVAAYHLAFGPDNALYVTGPTVSSFDAVTRIDRDGDAEVFYRGLGRPQGLAFDRAGNLYVAASLRGRRGIVRISPDGTDAQLAVAGVNVVGLAFSAT